LAFDESNVYVKKGEVKPIGTGGWYMTRCTNTFAHDTYPESGLCRFKCSGVPALQNVTLNFPFGVKLVLNWK